MIDTNETGNKKIQELIRGKDEIDWTEFEEKFLHDMRQNYADMSPRQKSMVGTLHDKLMGR